VHAFVTSAPQENPASPLRQQNGQITTIANGETKATGQSSGGTFSSRPFSIPFWNIFLAFAELRLYLYSGFSGTPLSRLKGSIKELRNVASVSPHFYSTLLFEN